MKRKALKILSILILFSFNYANAMSFGNKFMSHFARIGFITKKPVSTTLLRRSCSYLKNDAIAQSKKFNSVKPSLYLGAAGLGSFYYFNQYIKNRNFNTNSDQIELDITSAPVEKFPIIQNVQEPVPLIPQGPELKQSEKIALTILQDEMELTINSKNIFYDIHRLSHEEQDKFVGKVFSKLFDERNSEVKYLHAYHLVSACDKWLEANPETKRVKKILKDHKESPKNPDLCIAELRSIQSKELPLHARTSIEDLKKELWNNLWRAACYKGEIKQKFV